MKRRNKDLKWYAFYQEFNGDKLTFTNVLGKDFAEEILKYVKSKNKYFHIGDYAGLRERVRLMLMHQYWSRTEYEVVVSNWHSHDMEQKIDIWFQLEPNLDRICEYIIRELQLDIEVPKWKN